MTFLLQSNLVDVARTFRSCCLRRDEAPGADDVCIICLEGNFASRPVGARRVKCQQCGVVYHRNCLVSLNTSTNRRKAHFHTAAHLVRQQQQDQLSALPKVVRLSCVTTYYVHRTTFPLFSLV